MEEEIGHAEVKLVRSYAFGPTDGSAFVYEVIPHPVPDGMRIESFYVATFDDDNTEIVWGCGPTIRKALEDAVIQWTKVAGEEEENPFKKILEEGEKDD